MQDLVGIIRTEDELREGAARSSSELKRARPKRVRVEGHRQYNPGWHLALDLASMLTVVRGGDARRRSSARRAAAATPATTIRSRTRFGKVNIVIAQATATA